LIKWVIVVAVALIVLSATSRSHAKLRLGRLPGDLTLRYKGRDYYLPFTTTILLSIALSLIARLI